MTRSSFSTRNDTGSQNPSFAEGSSRHRCGDEFTPIFNEILTKCASTRLVSGTRYAKVSGGATPLDGGELITATAVDGQGKESPKYLSLLDSMLERGVAERAIFFTSDPSCSHPRVQCTRIPVLDYFAYSQFCVEQMHSHIESDFCLTVQLDGFAVNPDRWESTFFDYDYIGAPWRSTWSRKLPEDYRVGNGGFSLRSQKFLREGAKLKWNADWSRYRLPHKRGDVFRHLLPFRYRLGRATWGNEDVYLAWVRREQLDAQGVKFAPVDVARRFAVQHCTALDKDHTVDRTFGFHGEDLFPAVRRELRRQGVAFPYESEATHGRTR